LLKQSQQFQGINGLKVDINYRIRGICGNSDLINIGIKPFGPK